MSTQTLIYNPVAAGTERPNAILRVLPSLTDVAFILPIVFLFWKLGGAGHMLEGDTGWHVRTGEWILKNGRVPQTDIFSFTKAGESWFAWEWLWDVAFAWLHQYGGMAAVVLASLGVLCVTSALLFRLVLRACPNVFIAFVATWVTMAAGSIHWLARPHLFTLLFTVIFLHVLERTRDGSRRALPLLPLLMLAWVNLHGGFIIGLLLVGVYAAGDLLAAILESGASARRRLFTRALRYGVTGAACGIATFVNPYFYRLHLHVLHTLTDPESPLYRFVGEWQPTALRAPLSWYVEPMIVLAVAGAVWHLLNRRFVYPLLVFVFLHSMFIAVRNLPVFLLIAAPVAAAILNEAVRNLAVSGLPRRVKAAAAGFMSAAEDFGSMDAHWRTHLASVSVFAILALAFYAPAPAANLRAEFDPKRYPVSAVDKFGSSMTAAVFTEDEWGDYLIYRLYPAGKVFVDGRFDLYGGKFTETYLDVLNSQYTWQATLDKYAISTVLLNVKTPLAGTLKESPRWQVVYDDSVAIIFRSRQRAAKPLPSVVARNNGNSRDGQARPEGVAVAQPTIPNLKGE